MKFKIVYKKESESIFPWKSRFRGVVLWPYVIMRPRKYATGSVAQSERATHLSLVHLYRHELQHCYQIKRMGVVKFYLSYLWMIVRKGYDDHPLEHEANQHERVALTQLEQKWLREGVIDLSEMDLSFIS